MKRMIAMLLALGLLLGCAAAESVQLPVLTAQLGAAAVLVDMQQVDDEYTEVLMVEDITVIMGRYAGEKTTEEVALWYGDDFSDSEILLREEIGVNERGIYTYSDGQCGWVIDTTVIWLDGYTYAFTAVVEENAYFGYITDEPMSAHIDWLVETLDVFDGSAGGVQ